MREPKSWNNIYSVALVAGAIFCADVRSGEFEERIVPFLDRYCIDCHDDLSKEGDLDLLRFGNESDVMGDRAIWASVYEKVESHQMPPPKKGSLPSDDERAEILAWIEGVAARPDPVLAVADPGKPELRRLTRLEYNNTIRDLFGLDIDIFIFPERLKFSDRSYFRPDGARMGDHVTVPMREYGGKYRVLLSQAGLPGDSRAAHGFRNRGEAMNFSPLLLEKYVEFAHDIAHSPELPMRSSKYVSLLGLDPKAVPKLSDLKPRPSGYSDAPIVPLSATFAPDLETVVEPEGGVDGMKSFRNRVSEAYRAGRGGVIDLPELLGGSSTIAGKGGLLKAQFGDRILTVNPNEDLWVAGFGTAVESSGPLLMTNKRKQEKVFELTFDVRSDDQGEGVERLGVFVLGRQGESGSVTLTAKLSDDTETSMTAEIAEGEKGTTLFTFASIPGESIRRLHVDGSQFSGDYVLLDDIGVITNGSSQPGELVEKRAKEVRLAAENHGKEPVPKVAPKPEPEPVVKKLPARERLAGFVEEAFRRPVSDNEVDRFYNLYESVKKTGGEDAAAMKVAVQAVLSSSGFLFLELNGDENAGKAVVALDDFELASRLSYFLWSSQPDEELFAVARAGKLSSDPEELGRQARRMLKDPRAKELSESFAAQWLRLDQLYTAKPDRSLFGDFYSGQKATLHGAALVEALLLFETVLIEDRSILDFIDPGYSWLNTQLADLYGIGDTARSQIEAIKGVPASGSEVTAVSGNREVQRNKNEGSEWYRVELPDARRGGFLAMSGPLTVTSLPFRTSPVKRGAWLLETVFNRPPTEPKVAFVIENDTKEAAKAMSIREKFEDHRSKAACYSCHIRLDPPGFALESFDPIGAWRELDGGAPVDAGGEWNGVPFDGPSEFKQLIAENPDEFTRGFIEHLLSYALSRKLGIYDMPTVSGIQDSARADDWKFATIVAEIVKSYPFTHVRSGSRESNQIAKHENGN